MRAVLRWKAVPPATPWRRLGRAQALAGLSLLASACDPAGVMAPIPSSCAQIGAQCQLPGGPLGVCQQIDCDAGAAAPCFKCVSQH